jgi:threonine/homoserine efflux transporter RhtA
MALLPVTATITGLVALRQTPGGFDLLGIGLVVVGIAVSERSREPLDPSQAA